MSAESADGDFGEICYLMGLALVTWQNVENAHFKIFCKMLGAPLSGVTSAAYYSTESFDARRRVVGNMAAYFLEGRQFKKQRADWAEIDKLIKDANENRNKLAHYAMDYDFLNMNSHPDGTVTVEFTPHRLRPTKWNFVSRLLGRTPDKDAHNLGPEQIKRYIVEFRQLAGRLEFFHANLVPPSELPAPADEQIQK